MALLLIYFGISKKYYLIIDIDRIENGYVETKFQCPGNHFNIFVLQYETPPASLEVSGNIKIIKDGVLLAERRIASLKPFSLNKTGNAVAPRKHRLKVQPNTTSNLYKILYVCDSSETAGLFWDSVFQEGEWYTLRFDGSKNIPDGTSLCLTCVEFKHWWTPWR